MSGPIRGLHDVEGKLFAVSGRTLYQISNAGVAIPRGTIPGVGRVGMAHNQKAGGNELIVVNGSGGYVWNTATENFTVVTDEGYPGASVVDFVDGYLMQVEPFGRFLFHSDLADALGYNTLDRFEAETAPDRTVGMIVNHQEVWAFGERTIDVFGNTGSAQGTFQNKGVSIARGCAAKWSPAVVDNGTAWLGDDLKVYHATGYGPVRISTRAIEVALGECAKADIRNAFSFVWEDRSHSVYYLTVPNGPTFGFDFSTRLWHRRASWHPERDISGRWRLADLVKSNGEWIGGDYQTGQLFKLDWDYMMEGCEPLVRERVSPVAHNNGSRFTVDEVELFVTTGGKATECVPFPHQPVGPSIWGEAPDGLMGDAYSFTYTVTGGSAPIVRTVLYDTALPAGWAWDESTATISHEDTPVPVGRITLKMRTLDENGLWAIHEDEFVIAEEFLLLVTGSAVGGGEPMMATATAIELLEFTGILQSSGANLQDCVPARNLIDEDEVWLAVHGTGYRYSTDQLQTWQSGTNIGTGVFPFLACGPAGILSGKYEISGSANLSKLVPGPPGNFSSASFTIPDPGDPYNPLNFGAINMGRYTGGRYYVSLAGRLVSATSPAGPWTLVQPVGFDGIDWIFDILDFGGDRYITCQAVKDVHPLPPETRSQLRRWNAGDERFSDVLVDNLSSSDHIPWQLEGGNEVVVVYCYGGEYVYQSGDGFATPIATGIASAKTSPIWTEAKGRQVVFAAGRFFLISSANPGDPSLGNRCVSTVDGQSFTSPVSLGISNALGIAAGPYVSPTP